jgi:hypothetical protein
MIFVMDYVLAWLFCAVAIVGFVVMCIGWEENEPGGFFGGLGVLVFSIAVAARLFVAAGEHHEDYKAEIRASAVTTDSRPVEGESK